MTASANADALAFFDILGSKFTVRIAPPLGVKAL